MDVASIAALATQLTQVRHDQAVQVAVLKKALDVQAGGALQLLQAAAQAAPVAVNPSHLGQRVDTFA